MDREELNDCLNKASSVFLIAGQLGIEFRREKNDHGRIRIDQSLPKIKYNSLIYEFIEAVIDCRDMMMASQSELSAIVKILQKARNYANKMRKADPKDSGIYELFSELNSLKENGCFAVDELRQEKQLDDPLSFLDEIVDEIVSTDLEDRADPQTPEAVANQSQQNEAEVRKSLDEPGKITQSVIRIFYPLSADSSILWRQSLLRLRDKFITASDSNHQLTCLILHSIIPAWPKKPELPDPPEIVGKEWVGIGGGPHKEPTQNFERIVNGELVRDNSIGKHIKAVWGKAIVNDRDFRHSERFGVYRPAVAEKPEHDATGKPMLYPDGKPIAMSLGANRRYHIYAKDLSQEDLLANQLFDAVAIEAGEIIQGLPKELNRIVWHQWLDGFYEIHAKDFWINAFFELAWRNMPGSSLTATKFAWYENIRVPLNEVPYLRDQGMLEGRSSNIGDPPAHWYSIIIDLISASIAAIDMLIAFDDENIKASEDSISNASTDKSKLTIEPSENTSTSPPSIESDEQLSGLPYEVDENLCLIRIDGEAKNVAPEAARMAKLLLDNIGNWVAMSKNNFTKPSEVKSKLPNPILDMLETEKGKGYRLKRAEEPR